MLKAISLSFFFFLQSRPDFFASISNDRSNSHRFIRKQRNFTSCLSFHPYLFSLHFFFLILSHSLVLSSSFSFRTLSFPYKREISYGLRIKRDNWKIVIQLFAGLLDLDLNSRLNEYNSLEILKIRYSLFNIRILIDFWITNNIKKNRWNGKSIILFFDRIFNMEPYKDFNLSYNTIEN